RREARAISTGSTEPRSIGCRSSKKCGRIIAGKMSRGFSTPYVDGRPWQALFHVSNDLVDCGHMSGLLERSIYPLALMKSDNQDPYQARELSAHGVEQVVPGLRWRPCRSSRFVALAKLEPVNLLCEHALRR
ncbi:MAG: hypothetical protein WA733_25615, partial [Methylocystis sp.]